MRFFQTSWTDDARLAGQGGMKCQGAQRGKGKISNKNIPTEDWNPSICPSGANVYGCERVV